MEILCNVEVARLMRERKALQHDHTKHGTAQLHEVFGGLEALAAQDLDAH